MKRRTFLDLLNTSTGPVNIKRKEFGHMHMTRLSITGCWEREDGTRVYQKGIITARAEEDGIIDKIHNDCLGWLNSWREGISKIDRTTFLALCDQSTKPVKLVLVRQTHDRGRASLYLEGRWTVGSAEFVEVKYIFKDKEKSGADELYDFCNLWFQAWKVRKEKAAAVEAQAGFLEKLNTSTDHVNLYREKVRRLGHDWETIFITGVWPKGKDGAYHRRVDIGTKMAGFAADDLYDRCNLWLMTEMARREKAADNAELATQIEKQTFLDMLESSTTPPTLDKLKYQRDTDTSTEDTAILWLQGTWQEGDLTKKFVSEGDADEMERFYEGEALPWFTEWVDAKIMATGTPHKFKGSFIEAPIVRTSNNQWPGWKEGFADKVFKDLPTRADLPTRSDLHEMLDRSTGPVDICRTNHRDGRVTVYLTGEWYYAQQDKTAKTNNIAFFEDDTPAVENYYQNCREWFSEWIDIKLYPQLTCDDPTTHWVQTSGDPEARPTFKQDKYPQIDREYFLKAYDESESRAILAMGKENLRVNDLWSVYLKGSWPNREVTKRQYIIRNVPLDVANRIDKLYLMWLDDHRKAKETIALTSTSNLDDDIRRAIENKQTVQAALLRSMQSVSREVPKSRAWQIDYVHDYNLTVVDKIPSVVHTLVLNGDVAIGMINAMEKCIVSQACTIIKSEIVLL